MQNKQEIPDHLLFSENGDRRRQARIYDPFPAMVRGVDASGTAFLSKTTIDNISTDGLYLRLMQQLAHRTKVYIVVQLSNAQIDSEPAMRLHLSGEVLRVEPRLGGACGVAVTIKNNRFI
jgi:hypothetical protein